MTYVDEHHELIGKRWALVWGHVSHYMNHHLMNPYQDTALVLDLDGM
jgi:hypothetical protein